MKIYVLRGYPKPVIEVATLPEACPTCGANSLEERIQLSRRAGKELGQWLHTKAPSTFADAVRGELGA